MDRNFDHRLVETTDKDFEIFKDECEKWIQYFGLLGWSVLYSHEKIGKESMADIIFNVFNRAAVIRLNIERPESEYTGDSIRKSAFHEVCELFLGRLTYMAETRFLADGGVEEETHNIIRTLENKIFKRRQDE